jgi:hypothetical protein
MMRACPQFGQLIVSFESIFFTYPVILLSFVLDRPHMEVVSKFHIGFKGQASGRAGKRSIHGYVSIYRRSATQPLGPRWGFETTSKYFGNLAKRNRDVNCSRQITAGRTGRRHLCGQLPVFSIKWPALNHFYKPSTIIFL